MPANTYWGRHPSRPTTTPWLGLWWCSFLFFPKRTCRAGPYHVPRRTQTRAPKRKRMEIGGKQGVQSHFGGQARSLILTGVLLQRLPAPPTLSSRPRFPVLLSPHDKWARRNHVFHTLPNFSSLLSLPFTIIGSWPCVCFEACSLQQTGYWPLNYYYCYYCYFFVVYFPIFVLPRLLEQEEEKENAS